MLTIKLNIKETSNSDYIANKQQQYSFAFRKAWKNVDKIKNNTFLDLLKTKFNLTDIEVRSLVADVKTKFEQTQTNKLDLEETIIDTQNEIITLEKEIDNFKNERDKNVINKSKDSLNFFRRKLFKLNKKLKHQNQSLPNDIVFGGRKLLSEISFLNNNKEENENLINKKKSEFSNNRILSTYF
jgi:hypothetical protein